MTTIDDRCAWCDEMPEDHTAQEFERCSARLSDPLVSAVDDECPACGALMANQALHESWHASLAQRLGAISEKAGQYVHPTVYR